MENKCILSALEKYHSERIDELEKRVKEQQDHIDALQDKHATVLHDLLSAYLTEKEGNV